MVSVNNKNGLAGPILAQLVIDVVILSMVQSLSFLNVSPLKYVPGIFLNGLSLAFLPEPLGASSG